MLLSTNFLDLSQNCEIFKQMLTRLVTLRTTVTHSLVDFSNMKVSTFSNTINFFLLDLEDLPSLLPNVFGLPFFFKLLVSLGVDDLI